MIESAFWGFLLRLGQGVGYEISDPLPVPPVFDLIAAEAGIGDGEMHEVFNMGCGFCVTVPEADLDAALALLRAHYPAARRIGSVTDRAGVVTRAGRG